MLNLNVFINAKFERFRKCYLYLKVFRNADVSLKLANRDSRLGLMQSPKNMLCTVRDTNIVFSMKLCCLVPQKFHGRKSSVGRAVCRLRKVYYSARHEAQPHLEEIVGETGSEADGSEVSTGGAERSDPGDSGDDIIRCICGLYKDEGLMIQCEKCLVCTFTCSHHPRHVFL